MSIAVASFAALSLFTAPQAQAGLLEMIFGVAPAPPRIEYAPLEMTVRPRKKVRPKAPRTAARAPVEETKPVLVTPIDPVANPHWYLTDPTLRRGDIVVLPDRVLVFAGDRGRRRLADFDTLYKTRLVSRRDRERVRLLTEYTRGPMQTYKIVPDTAEALPAAIEQGERKPAVILQ